MTAYVCFCEVHGGVAVGMFGTRQAAKVLARGDVIVETCSGDHTRSDLSSPVFFWPTDRGYHTLAGLIERARLERDADGAGDDVTDPAP